MSHDAQKESKITVLTDIVNIQISRETTAVAREAFNIPCFISEHTAFSERARVYTSLAALQDDFSSTSKAYIAASKFFGQDLVPQSIVIGRKQIDGVDGSIATVTNLGVYTLTINNVEFEFTADGTATAIEIVAGLKTAYDLAPVSGVTFTNNLDGTFEVDVAPAGTAWSIKASANIALVNKASAETWPDAIAAVQNENDTWYALTIESHADADILAVAADTEAKKKIYAYSSSAAAIKTNATTDIASQLKALSYDRTFGLYSPTADTEYPECSWVGGQLQEQPGSNTWAYKTLSGTTVYKLTGTETQNIVNKNISSYETVGGVNVTVGGMVASSEWVDTIIGIDWLESRMKERVWFRLANLKKVPYTQSGLAIFESEIRAQLSEAVRVGLLDETPPYQVFVPRVLDIAPNLRAQRTVEGITFTARLAGAVHKVFITGTCYI